MAAQNRYDLRSGAVNCHRDQNKQHKWCPKFAQKGRPAAIDRGPGNGGGCVKVRPFADKSPFRTEKRTIGRKSYAHHSEAPFDDRYHLDSGLDSDVDVDDLPGEIDSPTDTGTGQIMFEAAFHEAEVKFEDKQTSKLVKDEYDVVDDGEDDGPSSESVDDDFEMV